MEPEGCGLSSGSESDSESEEEDSSSLESRMRRARFGGVEEVFAPEKKKRCQTRIEQMFENMRFFLICSFFMYRR